MRKFVLNRAVMVTVREERGRGGKGIINARKSRGRDEESRLHLLLRGFMTLYTVLQIGRLF